MARSTCKAHGSSLQLRGGLRPRPPRRARPAGPLLLGLVVGLVAAAVVAIGWTPDASARPVAAVVAAPADLGRLPDCAGVLAGMTARARLAQRLMVGVDTGDPRGAAELVRGTQVGGIFLGGADTQLLTGQSIRALQAVARIPVAVAVDDEGGRVQRLDALDGDLPSAREMGELSLAQVRVLAQERGRALAARGVTMDLAPVVDLGGQPAGAVIGDRAFDTDPAEVARYAAAFADGLHAAGLHAVLKHFPGHGRADGDSHRGRVATPPLDELRTTDLAPYTDLIGPGGALTGTATAVMVGHLDVPGLTGELPSSLTPAVYALLREQFAFDGLVLTDDLGAMQAVTGTHPLPEAVLAALAAGADMALWSAGGDVGDLLDVLEAALADGRLDPGANDLAVTRVLRAKLACA